MQNRKILESLLRAYEEIEAAKKFGNFNEEEEDEINAALYSIRDASIYFSNVLSCKDFILRVNKGKNTRG